MVFVFLDLEFDSIPGKRLGLVLGFRQTLLTTYLFYQGLTYMGNSTYLTPENLIKVLSDASSYHDRYRFKPEDVQILKIKSAKQT